MSVVTGYIQAMLGIGVPMVTESALYYLTTMAPLLACGLIGSTPLPKLLYSKLTAKDNLPAAALAGVLLIIGFLSSTAYLVAGTYNPFLYFRF